MRRYVSLAVSAALLVGLTACSAGSSSTVDCTPLATGGSLVDSVEVTGGFGEKPTATFPTPLTVSTTERKVLVEGSGSPALPGGATVMDFTLYNGKTGELLGQTSYTGNDLQTATLSETSMVTGFISALQCSTPGTRVVAVVAPSDLLDPNGNVIGNLDADAPLVMIADVVSTSLSRATGKSQPIPDGMPSVVLDSNGVPGITIPQTEPPQKLETAVLIKGDGPVVSAGASVTVHYTGVLWSDGKVFDSSWTRSTPATFSLDGVVPGFAQAIEGQTVGSQVLAVIPPDLAYGDQDNGTIPPGSSLVFVIDILSATK